MFALLVLLVTWSCIMRWKKVSFLECVDKARKQARREHFLQKQIHIWKASWTAEKTKTCNWTLVYRICASSEVNLGLGFLCHWSFLALFFGYKKALIVEAIDIFWRYPILSIASQGLDMAVTVSLHFLHCISHHISSRISTNLQAPISLPVRTNQIPRQVPAQPWYITGDLHSAIGSDSQR